MGGAINALLDAQAAALRQPAPARLDAAGIPDQRRVQPAQLRPEPRQSLITNRRDPALEGVLADRRFTTLFDNIDSNQRLDEGIADNEARIRLGERGEARQSVADRLGEGVADAERVQTQRDEAHDLELQRDLRLAEQESKRQRLAVPEALELQLAEARLAAADFDPTAPRGSFVDIRA